MTIGGIITSLLLFVIEIVTYLVFILFIYCGIIKIVEWIIEIQDNIKQKFTDQKEVVTKKETVKQ